MKERRPQVVPEPGQRVRLRTARGRWRGSYRALSEPFTDEGGVVVVRVADEEEYRSARREGRSAIGMPWPVRQMAAIQPAAGSEEATAELPVVVRQYYYYSEKPPQEKKNGAAMSGSAARQARGSAREQTSRRWWGRVLGGFEHILKLKRTFY